MGGGAAGQINEQTGAFTTALPLVSLPGRGQTAVELALAYDQTAAGAGADRFSLGQGIGLGKAYVDPADGGALHTPGGSFPISPADTSGTGLKRYLLKDLSFREAPGTLAPRPGLEGIARSYKWVLTRSDGHRSFFSAAGDLTAEEDAFGNQSAYAWELRGGQHRLEKAVDAYGQAVIFDYSLENQVTVTSPQRSDGKQPTTVLHLSEGRLVSVVYPENQTTALAWDYAPAGMPGRLLTRIDAPAGSSTRISYAQPHGFPVTSSVKVTDRDGRNLTAERTFRLGAEGEHAGHDFTGSGQYTSADELFDSADADYRYTTELSDGRSTVRSVFNSLHLLKERTALLNMQGELKPVRTQKLEYAGERDGGQTPPAPAGLPANFSKPSKATVTVHDPATGRTRTTTETAQFDDHGRQTRRTDITGATTVTEYDPTAPGPQAGGAGAPGTPAGYGLPLRTTVTGSDGAQTITENTPSQDRRSIAASRQLVKNKGEEQPSARSVTRFTVSGHGELTAQTSTWAPDAEPDTTDGPEEITRTYGTVISTSAHTRTDTVKTAAGTSTQTTDLVTGHTVSTTDTQGRTTSITYDQAGRVTTHKTPGGPDGGGLLTRTSYTPTTTTVSTPGKDGRNHVTVQERDLLGRIVKQTDNVRNGELTGDPAARTLQTVQFEDQGRTARVTDSAGRITVTTSDDLGRPVRTVAPSGLTQLTLYADAATADTSSVTTLTLPAGETDPARAAAASTEISDQSGRPLSQATAFADGTRQSASSKTYDSLGRTARSVFQDITAAHTYGSAGTVPDTTLTPASPTFPGEEITATVPTDLTGAPVVKTLTPGQDTSSGRSGLALVRDSAGRVTEQRRPDGRKTAYSYTSGGQASQAVSPGGTRTLYRYHARTGQLLQAEHISADGRTTEKTAYSYDEHTGALTGVYDPGNEAATRISYTYDADGNVTEAAYPDGTAIRQKFADSGQLQKVTDAAGLTTFYAYNPDGTLSKAVQHERDDTASPVKASVTYTYDGLGRITSTDRGNGTTTQTQYTSASQIRHEKTTRSGSLVSEASYTYDSHNNLTQRTDTRPAARPDGTPEQHTTTTTRYSYDAYNRLLSSQVLDADGRQLGATRYTVNIAGDVTRTETTHSSKTSVTEHTIDTSGRLTALTTDGQQHPQTFDSEGNLTTGHDGTTYTYNLHNQPLTATAPGGKTTRYTYWADGTRATATELPPGGTDPGRTTTFHYSPGGLLLNDTHTSTDGPAHAQQRAGITASYLMAGTRHARILTGDGAQQAAATGEGYLITDRHGSTTALSSNSGETVQAWNYTDYGQNAGPAGAPHAPGSQQPAGAARNPFTYAGEHTGPEGTQYLRTRIYDPVTKRFTTADAAPQFNRYQAMGANPVNRIDPQGTTEIPDWASWLIWGFTTAAALVTLAATAATTGPFGVGTVIALAGAVLDAASGVLDAAAIGTGRDQIDDPLTITALALGAAGLALGIGSGIAKAAQRGPAAAKYIELDDFAGSPSSPAGLPGQLTQPAPAAGGTAPQTPGWSPSLPSHAFNPDARPRGTVTPIPQLSARGRAKLNGAKDTGALSIIRENDAARRLAIAGFDIMQNPPALASGAKPDYLIGGKYADCYTPFGKLKMIYNTIDDKVTRQAKRIVLNLAETTVTKEEVMKEIQEFPIETLEEIIVLDAAPPDGGLQNIYRIYPDFYQF
ncbi:RHS repeat-associated core domain-containing protein [Streptomyces sp. NPDC008121]|uniref:CdiA C-terminal domain-containing protein n=1 Tax=Streptomyces sp. NPDC008121 TaxID=3364809 RepID=UPI0036F18024